MPDSPNRQNLPRQIAGAVVWGIFFIVAPIEILISGSLAWLPLFIWRERKRIARYGFLPGATWKYGVIVAVVTLGALAPLKYEDDRIGPFPHTTVTLGELRAAHIIAPLKQEQYEELRVALPSTSPTRLELMNAIGEQTQLETSIFRCGNGATILFGFTPGLITAR